MATKRNKDEVMDYDQMPLMDSFLKETARIDPTTIRESQLQLSEIRC